MNTVLPSQPLIERIPSYKSERSQGSFRRLYDSRPKATRSRSLKRVKSRELNLSPRPSQELIPVPTLSETPRSNGGTPCWSHAGRLGESPRKTATSPWFDSPTRRLPQITITRNSHSPIKNYWSSPQNHHLMYNLRLDSVDEESQGSGGVLMGKDELIAMGASLRPKRMKIERVQKELQMLGSNNEQKAQHLKLLAEKIEQAYERLKQKQKKNLLFEKKNNIIRSCVLSTSLERDIRKEMKENKEKWLKIFADKQFWPDFENHTWNWSESPGDLITRQSPIIRSKPKDRSYSRRGTKSQKYSSKSPTTARRFQSSRRPGNGAEFWK